MNFKIGCDPEVFVGDDASPRSIIGKLGGTKECPMPLPIGDGFCVQEDNVALEFNIPASDSKKAFIENVGAARQFLEKVVKDSYGLHFLHQSAISFPVTELDDPRAHVFGCEPDYNAWSLRRNPRPEADDKCLRSAGGHVHVGYDGLTHRQKVEVVRWLDLLLSVPATFMDDGKLRKRLYGKAGACRFKPYGVEYRPLSNFWIFSPKLCGWVYDNVDRALDAVLKGESISSEKANILAAVNDDNKEVADQLVRKYNLDVVYA
jgi:hypothetical protein